MAIQFRLIGNPATPDNNVPIALDARYIPETINVKNYGVTVGTGTLNDYQAIVNADAYAVSTKQGIIFPVGTYLIQQNLSIASPVILEPGAVISPSTGITVTFNGGISVPLQHVFSGAGSIAFGDGTIEEGYSEWWGAKINNGPAAATNLAAINAAITACPTVRFLPGDYFVSDTVLIMKSFRRLVGHAARQNTQSQATRICVTNGTSQVIRTAYAVDPGTNIGNFLREIYVENIVLTRSIVPAPVSAGNETNAPAGIHLYKTFFAHLSNVYACEHQIGFIYDGTVQSRTVDCHAFRSLQGSGGDMTNDTFWGYWQNGDAAIGLAGGNGSTYYERCVTEIGNAPPLTQSAGMRLSTSFVDTRVNRFESSACDFGIYVTGTRTGSADAQKLGNVDLHITGAINDHFNKWGIYVKDLAKYGAVAIEDCYNAPAPTADASAACIQIDTCVGSISITDNQAICWPQPSTFGLFITSSTGVQAKSNMYVGCQRPVALTDSSLCEIRDTMRAPAEAHAGDAAITLAGTCSRNMIAPNISAGSPTYPIGVNLSGASNDHNEINCTLIDPAALTGGSANKLVINGVQVTATGLSGTNLVSGVMN